MSRLWKSSTTLALGTLAAAVILFCSLTSGAEEQPAGRKLAFLVGVNVYQHAKLDRLDFAERDVEELAAILKTQGFQIVLMTGTLGRKDADLAPTLDNISRRFKALLKGATRDDLMLVGMAGHGLQPDGTSEAYYCPLDANPSIEAGQGTDPSRVKFPETLLKITGKDGLIAQLDDSGIGRKLLMIDACRNDASSGRGRGVAAAIVALPEETWVLLSCSRRERAFETKKLGGGHGVFFHEILEGLQGKAVDEEGNVTWNRLAEYVCKTVPRVVPVTIGGGAEQHPQELKSGTEVIALARITTRPNPPEGPMPKPEEMKPEPSGSFGGSRAGQVRNDNGLKTKLVWIPPGNFTMGSRKDEKERKDDENQVQVTLSKGFWLGQREVTQEEWQRVMQSTPWGNYKPYKGDNYPATAVKWHDAIKFCKTVTDQERSAGRLPSHWQYTLPTEAQWEYACRGGTKSRFCFGDDESDLGEYAWFKLNASDAKNYFHAVGQKKPNSMGLYDMHGNMSEWCRDWYSERIPGGTDPQGVMQGSFRVCRGGGWNLAARNCRSASRYSINPDYGNYDVGFRMALVPFGK